jgi:hypothetical protein
VILVQVGQDRCVHVGRCVAERGELRGEGVLLLDVEPGQPVVEVAREPAGEVRASVTEARSWPVSNRMSPSACSMT